MSSEAVYHDAPKTEEPCETTTAAVKVEPETVEQSDRGLFDFMGKKEEEKKCEDAAISSEFEQKVQVSEPEHKPEEEKKESLLEKLHRSDSSSSSSSDEECEDGEKKKKKKSLKDKIKDKIDEHKEKKEEEKIEKHEVDTSVPVEKYEEVAVPPPCAESPTPSSEEKKGFVEKIKEKLPGGHKTKDEEHVAAAPPPPPTPAATSHDEEGEHKEKKGIFEKIKEKIPGYHSKSEEEKEKEKVKECD